MQHTINFALLGLYRGIFLWYELAHYSHLYIDKKAYFSI